MVSIIQNAPIDTYVATFIADDADLGAYGIVTYTIDSGNTNNDLVLDQTTGVLKTFKLLDYERTPVYKVKYYSSLGLGDDLQVLRAIILFP